MKTYLFDFDGTLVDSMPSYTGVMKKILDDNNIKYPDDIIKIITPLGLEGSARYFVEKLGLDLPIDEIVEKMSEYAYYEYSHTIPAKDNVIEVLKILKKDNISLNVLTASPHITLDVCLKRLGVFDLFDNVGSCEDFNTTKADPMIYKMAAEKIGVPVEEILFFDDNYNADKTAKQAGMMVCGVYDDSSKEYVDEIKEISDYYIYDFKELLDV